MGIFRLAAIGLGVAAASVLPGYAHAGEVARHSFGAMPDSRPMEVITLRNHRGASATVITYGAALQSLVLPDARGRCDDVVLGHATLAEYPGQIYRNTIVYRFTTRAPDHAR